MRLKAYDFGGSDDVAAQYHVVVQASGDIGTLHSCAWSRALTGPKSKTTVNEAKNIIDFGKKVQDSVREGNRDLILPVIAYYGTGRLWDYHRDLGKDAGNSVSSSVKKDNLRILKDNQVLRMEGEVLD